MRYSLFFVALLLAGYTNGHSADRKSAAGFGLQYGGGFGWQGSLVSGRHRRSLGLGFIGASLGYDYQLNDRISVGIATYLSGLYLGVGAGIRAHYYPNGTFSTGWSFGFDVNAFTVLSDTDDRQFITPFVSIGYGYK